MSKVIIITGDQATGKTVLARKIADGIGRVGCYGFNSFDIKKKNIGKELLSIYTQARVIHNFDVIIFDEVDNRNLKKVIDKLFQCTNAFGETFITIITCQNAKLPKSYQDKATIIDLNYYKQCQPHN